MARRGPETYDTLVYDGSLGGFYSVLFTVFAEQLSYLHVERAGGSLQSSVFVTRREIATNPDHAGRIHRALKAKSFDTHLLYCCWLFATRQSDEDLLHLLVRFFREGAQAVGDYRDQAVFRCRQVEKKMNREIHRMHAFVRFEQWADGLYAARINPDFDVLPLAVGHFEDRYQDQEWLIWDEVRHYGYWFVPGKKRAVPVRSPGKVAARTPAPAATVRPADTEEGFQQLWSVYFDAVTIAARHNPRLHRQHVPLRYWQFLTEKRPKTTGS